MRNGTATRHPSTRTTASLPKRNARQNGHVIEHSREPTWPRPLIVTNSGPREYSVRYSKPPTQAMSYMYSGYGNSGYDYERGNYDRYAARPDPRDVTMYPVKKDLVPMGPSRIDQESRPRWSWCLSILSIIVLSICCPLFGLIGYSFVTHAYSDHKANDYYHVRYKRKCAWGWTIAGLIIGILGWLALIVVYALAWTLYPTLIG